MRARLAFSVPLLFTLPLFWSLFGPPALSAVQDEAARPVTVILVRHAETAASTRTQRDPELSAAGSLRAKALAGLLSAAEVSHLYSSQFRRTQATLAPLAALTELEVEVVDAQKAPEQIELLRALPPGSVAVVAGHSNTVPALVVALGGELKGLEEDPTLGGVLGHDEYDRLALLTLPAADGVATSTVELRYGP